MVNWTSLINKNKNVVLNFAQGNVSSTDFQRSFSGNPNPARSVVRNHGTQYARRLARKALRRRGLLQ
jgi:hypothetical protein